LRNDEQIRLLERRKEALVRRVSDVRNEWSVCMKAICLGHDIAFIKAGILSNYVNSNVNDDGNACSGSDNDQRSTEGDQDRVAVQIKASSSPELAVIEPALHESLAMEDVETSTSIIGEVTSITKDVQVVLDVKGVEVQDKLYAAKAAQDDRSADPQLDGDELNNMSR
jgi:hypothetical protein